MSTLSSRICIALLTGCALIGAASGETGRGPKAVQSGNAEDDANAAIREGLTYLNGTGGVQDPKRACDLFEVAEHSGVAEGSRLLADCFRQGVGRPRNISRSLSLYQEAAGNGDAEAQTTLGQMYLQGIGVQKDTTSATRWLRAATTQGSGKAALILGEMYWNGDGVQRNHAEAARFWHIAAKSSERSAPALLGKYYYTESFVPPEHRLREEEAVRAVYWNTVASMVDPDAAVRTNSRQLAEQLLRLEPDLQSKAQAMLTHAKGTDPD